MTKTAAIIGGGVIGGGWAARFALMGWTVRLFDPDPLATRKVETVLANARRSLPMLYDVALPPEGQIHICATLAEAVAGADWIQENVPEVLEVKHKVLHGVEASCSRDAFIASSTSGFTPADLGKSLTDTSRLLVVHPFNPVYLLPLAEVVPHSTVVPGRIAQAQSILSDIGMYPLHVRAEIDAHIADRLLEAVWREALWLVRDGIATTEEIDNAIRYGFGLRWAQMGLFETYRIAGGEAGMRHFMAQFGPALQWPWSRLTDVPEFTDELVNLIAEQSDRQSGALDIRSLERLRDSNLVALLRALKGQNTAAGALIRQHESGLRPKTSEQVPMVTQDRVVPADWADMNGHMNEGRYGQVFSDAAEVVMAAIGADDAYVAAGHSYFTLETKVNYLSETLVSERFFVLTRVLLGQGKKLRLMHEMIRSSDRVVLATCDQFMVHVSLKTRKSCDPLPTVQAAVNDLARLHAQEQV